MTQTERERTARTVAAAIGLTMDRREAGGYRLSYMSVDPEPVRIDVTGGSLQEVEHWLDGVYRWHQHRTKLLLLKVWGDVEPTLDGPYPDEDERTAAARDYRRDHGDENGVFRIDVVGGGYVTVAPFVGAELDEDES